MGNMQYRKDKHGEELSILGYGCMRFSRKGTGVDIEKTESKVSGWRHFFQAVALSAEPSFASQCVQCGKCEKHCPQGIPIREQLKKAEKALLPWPVKLAVKMGRRFMFGRR